MMRNERGFVMGIVLISLLALSVAGATAVLLSSTEVDMAGAMRQRRQLEACAAGGVEQVASNLPSPELAPVNYAVDFRRAATDQQFKASSAHINPAPAISGGILGAPTQELPPSAAGSVLMAAGVGQAAGNRPAGNGAGGSIKVYRLMNTCAQKSTGASLESEGVYVYNPL